MANPTIPIGTFESMVKQCLGDVRNPRGDRQRRRARQLHGARDAALLSLSYLYGATTSELLGLEWSDCRAPQVGVAYITFSDRPDRSQSLPVIGLTQRILLLWRNYSSREVLFYRISKLGKEGSGSLTPSAIRAVLKKRYNQIERHKQAHEVPTPERLRNSFKKLLKEVGVRDSVMRDIMGLRSRRHAPRDDNREDARMKKALRSINDQIGSNIRVPLQKM